MRKILRSFARNCVGDALLSELRKLRNGFADRRVVSIPSSGSLRGKVLLSYVLSPFVLKAGQEISEAHSNHWECFLMARTFADLGFSVDIINWSNKWFVPRDEYAIFVDVRWNMQRLAPLLNKDCIKIFHIETCQMLHHNAAEANRLLALQGRRGVTLQPRRFEYPNLGIEHADCGTILGNEATIRTFRYAQKPIHRIPISVPRVYPWSEGKDFTECRNRFLWFGSGGCVHKGLDLVLEAFAEMPNYHLTVCGPVANEKDFEKAYYRELYETPNISYLGWVDIASKEFERLANTCVGVVFVSASEGGGGSVITCMHAGVIPIVNYEASVDVTDDFGIVLEESSVKTIKEAVHTLANQSEGQLQRMARRAWDFARANHTKERFVEEYRKVIEKILEAPQADVSL